MARWLSPTWVVTPWVREDWYGDGTIASSWLSQSWVTTSWVLKDWFGDGADPSGGNWVATNWFRSGWINSAYLTNAGLAPTAVFVSDSADISLTENKSYLGRLLRTDVVTIDVSESFNLNYKRHVVAFETISVTVNEQQISRLSKTLTDTLAVTLSDVGTKGEGVFSQIAVSDTLNIEADDPGMNFGFQTVDSLGMSVTDTSTRTISLGVSDSFGVSLGEVSSKVFTGAFVVSVADSANIALGEVSNLHKFRAITISDSLNLSLEEIAFPEPGIIISYLQVFDVAEFSLDDAATLTAQVDTVAKAATDTIIVDTSEISTKVELKFFSIGDTLLLQVNDAADVAKISVQQTWDAANYPWGGSTLRDIKPLPVFSYEFDFYQVDSADTFIKDGELQGIPVVLERLGLTIYGRDRQGNWKEDPDIIKLVKGVYPIFRGEPGTVVNIYVGSQEDMEGAITWDGPHPFVIGEDTYVKPLISGPFIAIRFESSGQRSWKLLSYDLDITTVGRRN